MPGAARFAPTLLALALTCPLPLHSAAAAPPARPASHAAHDPDGRGSPHHLSKPVIQIALLLDTSGSMEGLIDQARTRLWDVVNVLSTARRDGRAPEVQVALYQYGSDALPSSEGFMTLALPLTTDLDAISERLFALRAGGSSEYCGQAIDAAVKQLAWNPAPSNAPLRAMPLRMVVIAGNEEFTQGPVSYTAAADGLRRKGLILNTVYCGDAGEGTRTGWSDAAALGTGAYHSIDHTRKIQYTEAPQDAEILRLNTALNATYLAYGARGQDFSARQTTQDSLNRAASPEAALSRTVAKSSHNYLNIHWDLVDALDAGSVRLESLDTAALPAAMQPMTLDERLQHVAANRADRLRIQSEIARLSAERDRWLESRRTAAACPETLDSALIRTVRAQAERVGFTFHGSRD